MEVTVRINVDSPTGIMIVREIQKHKKIAEIEYPLPKGMLDGTAMSHDEVWDEIWDKLTEHYGVDIRNL